MRHLSNRSMAPAQVIPELGYEDVEAAARWLCGVFGFEVRLRIGSHRVQLDFGTGSLVVRQGRRAGGDASSHSVMVRVRDVDAHFARAVAAGAANASAPETYPYGERQYSVDDLGGHRWTFSQSVEDVDPRSWGGVPGDPERQEPPQYGQVLRSGSVPSNMKIDHVQLAMPEGGEQLARAFYRDVLDMPEVPKPAPLAVNGGVWFRAGSAELHLGIEQDFRPAKKAHPAVRVPDLDAVAARCEVAGHTVRWDDRYPGVKRLYVHDPFGNSIEVMQAPEATAFAGEGVELLLHFLATIAYRTQKAVRGASAEYGTFTPGSAVRTPMELVRHMASVIGYARTFFVGGTYRPDPLVTFEAEVERLHANLEDLGDELRSGTAPIGDFADLTPARLLQGPLADAMTHAGQLALLRRLAGDPVPPENFVHADIDPRHVGADQPEPASPDAYWPDAPDG